jgi:hypothetical protein
MISAKKTKQENQTGKETNYFHKLGKVNETGVLKGGDSFAVSGLCFPMGETQHATISMSRKQCTFFFICLLGPQRRKQ